MAGSIESPYSQNECAVPPDGSNIYGEGANWYENQRETQQANDDNAGTPTNQQSNRDPPQSGHSDAMVTARPYTSPTNRTQPTIPTNISFPSTDVSTIHTVTTAPYIRPAVPNRKTPKTTNIHDQYYQLQGMLYQLR